MALINLVEKDTQDPQVAAMFRQIEKAFGDVGDNFRLAAVSPSILKEILGRGAYLALESGLPQIVFPVIRYAVSYRENGKFCIKFNGELLKNAGYTDEDLAVIADKGVSPHLSDGENALILKALKVVYQPEEFSGVDVGELKDFGFSERQILDAAEHAATMLKMTKILKAFKI